MAKSKKHRDGDLSAHGSARVEGGRQAIYGDNADHSDRVSQRAYELYLARGGEHGQDFEDWLTAERELTNGHDRRVDSSE